LLHIVHRKSEDTREREKDTDTDIYE
jgi:hypothetical protein